MAQTLEHNGSVTQVVPVEIPLCDVDVEVIQKLDDEPNDVGGLSAQELKERFDHVGGELKSYLNEKLIPTVVSDDLTEQTRQEAEAERVKNERERVGNEAGRAGAETARGTAEQARAAAEGTRAQAEEARAAAEGARSAAETARATAEEGRERAETARETAESARETAEGVRSTAETARAQAENGRETAEAARVTAENARAAAEGERAAAEATRIQAEGSRERAEAVRQSAETARETAEGARSTAETARAGAEKDRETGEAARVAAEEARATAETARGTAETARTTAEEGRKTAETAREAAEAARAAAEEQRVDTDKGIVAQATAQASLAAESAQEAAESQTAAAASAGEASQAAAAAGESEEAALEAKTAAETAKTSAEEAKTAAQAAKTGAETAKAAAEEYAGQVGESAQAAAASAAQAAESATLSTSEADRAKREADRAKAIAGGDFITPVELAEAVGEKANIPQVGTEEDLETLGAGGVLLVTDGGGEGAKARQIGVKSADGTLQVVELGGSGGKRVNGGDLVKEIQIANVSTYVKPGGRTLTWAEVEAHTPNTGVAPSEAEKELFKAEDGSYTLKRMVYDGYISKVQATNIMGLGIKAIAMEPTSKVTVYDKSWNKVTRDGESQATHVMNVDVRPFFGTLRPGMDDMAVAVNGDSVDYEAQQRVYFEVEREDGSAVDYCVLVIHNAKQYNNNVGLYDYTNISSGVNPEGRRFRGERFQDKVKAEGTAPSEGGYAIWIYPEEADIGICPPNAEVTLWSDEVKAKIDAGDTEGLTKDQISTVNTFGAVDEWGHHYPMAFRVSVPWCEMLHIKILAENPLSAVGIVKDNAANPVRPSISQWTEGALDEYRDLCGYYWKMGENLQFYAGVRTQEKRMSGYSSDFRGFTISVEFEAPGIAKRLVGSGASITLPSGTGNKVYTISDGTDVQSGRTLRTQLFTVLRHCNATYEVTATVAGKTYRAQIVTGPYYGEYTLGAEDWTEVTEA